MRLIAETPITRVPSHFGLIARVMLLLNGLSHRLAPGQMIVQRALVETLAAQSAGARRRRRRRTDCRRAPTAPPLLQALRWVQWPLPFLDECAQRFGDAFTLRLPSAPPIVMFSHPDAIKTIFTGDEEDLRAGEANFRLEPILGKHSLLLLDGQRAPARAPAAAAAVPRRAHAGLRRASCATSRPRGRRAGRSGGRSPIHPEMQGVTLDVILRTVFGLDEGPTKRDLRAALLDLLSRRLEPADCCWPRSSRTATRARRRGALLRGPRARRPPALRRDRRPPARRRRRPRRHPLAAGAGDATRTAAPLEDQALRDELMTMLLAGHETTATALAWAVSHVLAHPDVRARIARRAARASARPRSTRSA